MKEIVFISLFLLFPHVVMGAGVEASPSKLQLQTFSNTKAVTELTVRNPSADVQLFEIYADDFSDSIKIHPTSFVLEAGNSKSIAISYDAKRGKNTILKTNISVVARPLSESRFQFNSGIKIPITILINSSATFMPWWFIFPSVVIIICLFYFFWRKRRHQAKEDNIQ